MREPKRRYVHRPVPGWENASKCQGYKVITVGKFDYVVRCDAGHPHQRVICALDGEDGGVEYEILEAHPHGAAMFVPGLLKLRTEAESRAFHARDDERDRRTPAPLTVDDPVPF